MYKKGGNQKKGAKFDTFEDFKYKKNNYIKLGPDLFIIGFLKNVRNN